MVCINNVSVEYFKALFKEFPYLPQYVYGKAYFTDDIVYYNGNFYVSLKDGNLTDPSNTTNWKLANVSTDDYVLDSDIERAFEEAKINFNAKLFGNCNSVTLIYCYLAAHYLVIDLNNANNPLALGFMGFTQSKSVGSVSESYGIPQWMLNNASLGLYAQTGYGRKYLSLIKPYLAGQIIYTPGRVNFG